MPSRIVLVAEATAAAINAIALPIPVQAQMAWMPITDRVDAGVVACWVVPASETPASLGRQRGQYDCEVFVALQKAVESDGEANGLAENLEAIGNALFQKSLHLVFEDVPQGEAAFISMRIDPVLDPDHWNRLRQYTGVLRLVYRVFVSAGGA